MRKLKVSVLFVLSLVVCEGSNKVLCDDSSYCSEGTVCCEGEKGWMCCGYSAGVCCADKQYCCSSEYPVCVSGGKCATSQRLLLDLEIDAIPLQYTYAHTSYYDKFAHDPVLYAVASRAAKKGINLCTSENEHSFQECINNLRNPEYFNIKGTEAIKQEIDEKGSVLLLISGEREEMSAIVGWDDQYWMSYQNRFYLISNYQEAISFN